MAGRFGRRVVGRIAAAVLVLTGALALALYPQLAAAAPSVPFPVGTVFIADTGNHRVLQIAPGGAAQSEVGAGLKAPVGVAVDAAGNVYIADTDNGRVVKVPADGGAQTVVASGLSSPQGVAVDAGGNVLIADTYNNRVLRIPADGGPQTVVGSGLVRPYGVAVDTAGNVFIADFGNDRVLRVPADGGPQTVVGSPITPYGVTVDTAGNVFIADGINNRVVKVPADGGPQTAVGSGLVNPYGVALDAAGNVIIADTVNDRVVKVPADGGPQTDVATDLLGPEGLTVYAPPPTFTAAAPADTAAVGTAYSFTYTANTPTGEPAATFALASGTLPPGLTLNPTTGVLSGTPTTLGSYPFTVQTQNHINATVGPTATITVDKGTQTIKFTSTPPRHPVAGASYQAVATGGASGNPVTFTPDPATTPGACTITSDGLVTLTGPGTCIINADQAANSNYHPAGTATQTITITAAPTATPTPAPTSTKPVPVSDPSPNAEPATSSQPARHQLASTGPTPTRQLWLTATLLLGGLTLLVISQTRRRRGGTAGSRHVS